MLCKNSSDQVSTANLQSLCTTSLQAPKISLASIRSLNLRSANETTVAISEHCYSEHSWRAVLWVNTWTLWMGSVRLAQRFGLRRYVRSCQRWSAGSSRLCQRPSFPHTASLKPAGSQRLRSRFETGAGGPGSSSVGGRRSPSHPLSPLHGLQWSPSGIWVVLPACLEFKLLPEQGRNLCRKWLTWRDAIT